VFATIEGGLVQAQRQTARMQNVVGDVHAQVCKCVLVCDSVCVWVASVTLAP
jgi:hypothetical protein